MNNLPTIPPDTIPLCSCGRPMSRPPKYGNWTNSQGEVTVWICYPCYEQRTREMYDRYLFSVVGKKGEDT